MKLQNKGIPRAQNHGGSTGNPGGHQHQHPRYSSSHEETCTTWWQGAKGSGVRKEIYGSFSVVFSVFFLGYMKWYGICEVLDFESRCWDMVSIQWLWLNFSIEIKLQIKVCGFLSDFHWIAEFSLKISFLRTNISILIQGLQVSPVFLRFEASRFTPFSTPPKAAPTGMERPKVKSAGTTPTAAPTTVPAHNPVAAPGGRWWDVQTTNRSGNLSYTHSQKSGEQYSKTFDMLDSTGWILGDPQNGFLSPFGL